MRMYSILYKTRNNLINLKNSKSKIINDSKNLFPKKTNETPSNFCLNKNFIQSYRNTKDIPIKSKKFKSNTSFISKKNAFCINKIKFDTNYLRRISTKNDSKEYKMKNNENFLYGLNISKIKERKIDFIDFEFLLGQKNYFKKIFQHYDFKYPKYITKKINPYLSQDSNKYFNEAKLNKNSFEENSSNTYSMKAERKNISLSLYRYRNILNKSSVIKINNIKRIKFKKYKAPDIKKLKDLLFEYSKRKNDNIIEKEKNNDDNYNDYLKDISSFNSVKNKNEMKRININEHNFKIKNIKDYLLLFDKSDIYHNIKRINYNNKFFNFKKCVPNRSKS